MIPLHGVMRLYTLKRGWINEAYRVWLNQYDFIAPEALYPATCYQVAHAVVTGEQFIHTNNAAIVSASVQRIGIDELIHIEMEAWSHTFNRAGLRDVTAGAEPCPFEVVHLWKKVTKQGKDGRLMLRQSLYKNEYIVSPQGKIFYHKLHGFQDVREGEFRFYMNNAGLQQCYVERAGSTGMFERVEPVIDYAPAHVTALQSIEDAQERKTFLALPYRDIAWSAIQQVCGCDAHWNYLLEETAGDITNEQMIQLKLITDLATGALTPIFKYWTEGIKPSLALKWRPTAGLDPFMGEAMSAFGVSLAAGSKAAEELGKLMEDHGGNPVPRLLVEGLRPYIWRMVLCYTIMLRLERWTGTPIPQAGI